MFLIWSFFNFAYLTGLSATLQSNPISNFIFALCFSLCGYFFFSSMLFDPGYVPKLGGISQQKAAIDELFNQWIFDDQNFCVQCMVRIPLRGKHCKRCGRCVAKHDQYVQIPRV